MKAIESWDDFEAIFKPLIEEESRELLLWFESVLEARTQGFQQRAIALAEKVELSRDLKNLVLAR